MSAALKFLFGFVAFVFILLFFVFKPSVLAQTKTLNEVPTANTQSSSTAANPYAQPNNNPDVPKNLHTYTQNVMIEVASSLACQLGGIDPTDPHAKCLGVDHKTGKIGYVENGGGAIGVMSYMIATLYINPINSGDYIHYLANNFGFEKKAYAEVSRTCNPNFGVGYCGIFPLINIWTTMRNMIYLLFVVIFMAIGLGIMLRVKIDPRTVMSIENQIPKIIIAIFLATFSFAIAGFMVELMYIVIFLIFSVFSSIPIIGSVPNGGLSALTPEILQNSSAIGIANNLAGDQQVGGVFNMTYTIAGNLKPLIIGLLNIHPASGASFIPGFDILGMITQVFKPFDFSLKTNISPVDWIFDLISFGTAVTFSSKFAVSASLGPISLALPTFFAAFGTITGTTQLILREVLPFLLPYLIILIAIIWALFRLWFALIQAYIFFLLNVVAAPFWVLMGLIPGSKLSFTGWFREIAADLSAFVVAIVMFWLGKLFIDAFGCVPSVSDICDTSKTIFFVPPLIGANPSGNIIGAIIGIGTILSVPDALKLTRAAFKPPELDLKAVGRSVGVGAGFINLPKHLATAGTMMFGISHLASFGGPLSTLARRGKAVVTPEQSATTSKAGGSGGTGGEESK